MPVVVLLILVITVFLTRAEAAGGRLEVLFLDKNMWQELPQQGFPVEVRHPGRKACSIRPV